MAKHIHLKNAPYLLTINTQSGTPYFQEDIFCNIFLDVLAHCRTIKSFNVIAFKINPDHAHVIVQPTSDYTISQIMHSSKKTASLQINQIMHSGLDKSPYNKFEWTPNLKFYRQCYLRKFNCTSIHDLPKFDWQDGFDHRLIKTRQSLQDRIFYVQDQHIKHELPENKFLYVADPLPPNLYFIGERGKG